MASEDPQDQLDEAIKKTERLAEELNQEKDPHAQLEEAITELNPEPKTLSVQIMLCLVHHTVVRKELSQDSWRESRPEINICQSCNVKTAILRCRDYLPKRLYCEDCDVSTHAKFPLHNRESTIEEFYTPLPPTTAISLHSDGKYALHEHDCFLPLYVAEVICGCLTSTVYVGPGKHTVLVGINGTCNIYKNRTVM
ncbi:unnamed protein product, partial [Coregonus sp. 'balchen']